MAQHFLTDKDLAILKELVDRHRRIRGNTTMRSAVGLDHEEFPAPEIYIARTPSGGIPSAPGTGTSDPPGCAECQIYQLVPGGGVGTGTGCDIAIEEVEDTTKIVYNLSADDISGNLWILVAREKFGYWMAIRPQGGGGSGSGVGGAIPVRITSKNYTLNPFTTYGWNRVTSGTPFLTWTDGIESGTGTSDPLFSEENVDLKVPQIVRARRGDAGEWLTSERERVEIVFKSSETALADGTFPGILMRWDQTSNTLIPVRAIRLVDVNAP